MMNFKNAAYLSGEDGITVDYVKVDDDIAVKDSLYTVGRRGIVGTVLVHKVAGAAAERGMGLKEVKAVAEKAIANVRSIGFALTSCTVPAKGSPTFDISPTQMEYGVGIHGEPGIRREDVTTADELSSRMVTALLKELEIGKGAKEEIAVLVNGFGGTPLQELYLLNNAVTRELAGKSIKINRVFVGNYMTSLDMAGASVSIMKLDDELKELLSSECDAPAFKVSGPVESVKYTNIEEPGEEAEQECFTSSTSESYAVLDEKIINLNNIIYVVDKMSEVIIANEVPFCELDSHVGDGDFGMSIAKGFKQLKREWDDIVTNKAKDIGSFLEACSLVIMEYCGGASGPIWGSAFRAAGRSAGARAELTVGEFAEIIHAAVRGIQLTGERSFGRGAMVGDMTLIDALVPYAESWTASGRAGDSFISAFNKAAAAAVAGAKSTEQMVARMGRAGNIGERSIGYPDPGAHALGVIFTYIASALK
jgi:dihydroxyacetone kinase